MKEFLHQHGISFEAIDVSSLAEPQEQIREETGGLVGTPAVIIGTDARIGFDPEWMKTRLDLNEGDR